MTFYKRTVLTKLENFWKMISTFLVFLAWQWWRSSPLEGEGTYKVKLVISDWCKNLTQTPNLGGRRYSICIFLVLVVRQHMFMKLTFKEDNSCLEFWEIICFSSSKTLALSSFSWNLEKKQNIIQISCFQQRKHFCKNNYYYCKTNCLQYIITHVSFASQLESKTGILIYERYCGHKVYNQLHVMGSIKQVILSAFNLWLGTEPVSEYLFLECFIFIRQ